MRFALVLTSLFGVVLSALLVRMSTPSAGPMTVLGAAVCAPSARVNCDYVLNSRWSKIGPIPSAALGVCYFATLATWYGFVGLPNYAGRRWHWLPVAVNGIGVTASLAFIFVMAVWLPVWCTWCVAAHITNGVLLILAVRATPRAPATTVQTPVYPTSTHAIGVLSACIAIILLIAAGIISYHLQLVALQYQQQYLKATNNADYILWRYAQLPVQAVRVDRGDFVIGRVDAPNAVVAFTDFECHHCAGFHRYAARLTNLFPDQIRCDFRHYPLCAECNRYAAHGMHYFACDAARAAQAAHSAADLRRAYAYEELLFDNAWRLDRRPYRDLATSAGIDIEKWQAALTADVIGRDIERDINAAHDLGVEATPAIFLNGRRLENWNIMTTDAQPKVDLEATDQLWKRLLNTNSQVAATQPNTNK